MWVVPHHASGPNTHFGSPSTNYGTGLCSTLASRRSLSYGTLLDPDNVDGAGLSAPSLHPLRQQSSQVEGFEPLPTFLKRTNSSSGAVSPPTPVASSVAAQVQMAPQPAQQPDLKAAGDAPHPPANVASIPESVESRSSPCAHTTAPTSLSRQTSAVYLSTAAQIGTAQQGHIKLFGDTSNRPSILSNGRPFTSTGLSSDLSGPSMQRASLERHTQAGSAFGGVLKPLATQQSLLRTSSFPSSQPVAPGSPGPRRAGAVECSEDETAASSKPGAPKQATIMHRSPPASFYAYRHAKSSLCTFGGSAEEDDSSDESEVDEATRRIQEAYKSAGHPRLEACRRDNIGGLGLLGSDTAPASPAARRSFDSHEDGEPPAEDDKALMRKRSSYHLTDGHAAVELFLRLNHARQTMDFVRRQTATYGALDKAEMTVWEALSTLNELREYEAALFGGEDVSVDLQLMDHAKQTAELCRLRHPDKDWLHIVGLIHSLGKLLAHRKFGSQPQWAICGESFPVGCRFSPQIVGSQYFTANPDRRRRIYNTPLGVYSAACGLSNVYMSWSASEYLYLVLVLNQTRLPPEALFLIRYQHFATLAKPQSCYLPLTSEQDRQCIPLLRSFQEIATYKQRHIEGALHGDDFYAYYTSLMRKYGLDHKLLF